MCGVQEHAMQLLWHFCANYERIVGLSRMKNGGQGRMRVGIHACMLERRCISRLSLTLPDTAAVWHQNVTKDVSKYFNVSDHGQHIDLY